MDSLLIMRTALVLLEMNSHLWKEDKFKLKLLWSENGLFQLSSLRMTCATSH